MRKLDYLRNKLKKCKDYNDALAIEIPKEFYRKTDIKKPTLMVSHDLNTDNLEFMVVRHCIRDLTEDDGPITLDLIAKCMPSTTYVLHPKKGFDYDCNIRGISEE